jgi:hypothetical protein
VQDALSDLDKLTNEEQLMIAARTYVLAEENAEAVKGIDGTTKAMYIEAQHLRSDLQDMRGNMEAMTVTSQTSKQIAYRPIFYDKRRGCSFRTGSTDRYKRRADPQASQ